MLKSLCTRLDGTTSRAGTGQQPVVRTSEAFANSRERAALQLLILIVADDTTAKHVTVRSLKSKVALGVTVS